MNTTIDALDFLLILFRKQQFLNYDDLDFIVRKHQLDIESIDFLTKKLADSNIKILDYSPHERVNRDALYKNFYCNLENRIQTIKGTSKMKENENFNFHQTFQPEPEYISNLLSISEEDFKTVKEISSATGIPTGESSGKVEPHILYASFMGLITYEKKEGKYKIHLTELGKCVYREDRGFQEELTILLCHCMLLRKFEGAYLWSFIFHDLFPYYEEGLSYKKMLSLLESKFGTKINQKNFAPFKSSYENIFHQLNLIVKDDSLADEVITVNQSRYNSEFIYLYAYVLYEYWDLLYSDQQEITADQLDEIGFKHPFGWTKETEYKILEHLSDQGIIRLNRQLIPFTIIRLGQKEDILNNLYSELC